MLPSVFLVPGICSVGSIVYAPLKKALHDTGFEQVTCIDLKSVDALQNLNSLTPNALEADIFCIRSKIKEEIENQGRDVVLVAHSYGGTPALYACHGLWKHDREKNNLKGGVIKICLIASSLSLPGETIAGVRADYGKEHGIKLDDEDTAKIEMVGQTSILYPDNLEKGFMADMLPDEQRIWSETLKPSAIACVMIPAPEGKPSDWRIAYLVTTGLDLAMPESFQHNLIAKAKEAGTIVGNVRELKSGHFVQITHVKEIAEWIQQASAS